MKKYVISALLVIMVLFLCGCGCEVNSQVTVFPDESGLRIMELTIPKSEIKTYGKVSLSEIDTLLAENCPECMTYSYEEDKKTAKATFSLHFDSYEDYEQKLNSFCDGNAEIYGSMTKSPFAQEVEYSESLSTREMLKWIPDVLIENKVLNERYRASVFEKFSTKLTFMGKDYDCGAGRVYIQDSLYCKIDSIDLYTSPAGGNKFNRVIKLNMQLSELEKNENGIRSFLAENTPEGSFASWETWDTAPDQIYSVSLTSLTPEEMEHAMEQFTGGGYAHFSADEESSANGLFGKQYGFTENIDWSNYVCSTSKTVNIRYILDGKTTEGELIDTEGGAYRRVNGVPLEEGDDEYLAYVLGEQYETTVKAQLAQYYHFSSIDYSVDAKGINDLEKKISLHFDNAKTEDIGIICDSIREMGKDDEIVSKIETELSETTLTLIFKGKASEVNHMMNAVSGKTDNDGLSYACESKWLAPLETCVVEDVADLDGFVYQGNVSEYWKIPVHYTAKIYGVGKELINDQPLLDEKMSTFEGTFTSDRRMKAVYRSKRINGLAFVWYLLLFLAFAAFAGGVYFLIRSFIEKRRENKEEKLAREIGVGEAVEIVEPVKEPALIEEKSAEAEETKEEAEEAIEETEEEIKEEIKEETKVETKAESLSDDDSEKLFDDTEKTSSEDTIEKEEKTEENTEILIDTEDTI